MIVGTAGHIDHGKTSLVRALTGVDGDRLKEEKARGITIDLGFAYLPLEDGPIVGFVDVPGHERFVHTMVAGASGIDFALLVVAADDGVMPQTREHLAILDLLGIDRGVVALTKIDAATPERVADVAAQIHEALAGTSLDGADIVPVSSMTGAGVDALRDRLAAEARGMHARADDARFRLAIDRVFTLAGIGVVVTGTVLSGTVQVKDTVLVSPSGLGARVRSVHAQNRPVDSGHAGQRCALNLVGDRITKDAIRRGDMVVDPSLHAPSDRIDASLHLLPGESKALGQWSPVRLHHAAMETGAHLVLLEGDALLPGQSAHVQLVLDQPIAAAALDRFVIRDPSAQRTLGGGQFLNLRGPVRQRRSEDRVAQRAALTMPDPVDAFRALLAVPPLVWDLAAFVRDRALPVIAIDTIATALSPVLFDEGGQRFAIGRTTWHAFVDDLVARLETFHAAEPDRQGMGREKLRLATSPRLPATVFVQALHHPDLASRIVRDGAFVRLPGHSVQMGEAREVLWQAIAPLLGDEARFLPPRVRDIAGTLGRPEDEIRQLLKFAARLGFVDEVAHDRYYLRATVQEMVSIAADLAAHATGGRFVAAQFRDRLGIGRKVAIEILEFFDLEGITINRGTLRRMQPRYLDLFDGRETSPVGRPDFKSG